MFSVEKDKFDEVFRESFILLYDDKKYPDKRGEIQILLRFLFKADEIITIESSSLQKFKEGVDYQVDLRDLGKPIIILPKDSKIKPLPLSAIIREPDSENSIPSTRLDSNVSNIPNDSYGSNDSNDSNIPINSNERDNNPLHFSIEVIEKLSKRNSNNPKNKKSQYNYHLLWSENGLFHKHQIYITYKSKSAIHEYNEWKKECFYNFKPNLKKPTSNIKTIYFQPNDNSIFDFDGGFNFNLLVIGDSISEGANCSKLMNLPPYQGSYPELIKKQIEEYLNAQGQQAYSNHEDNAKGKTSNAIGLYNLSLGGMNSAWGAKNLLKRMKESGYINHGYNSKNEHMSSSNSRSKSRIKTNSNGSSKSRSKSLDLALIAFGVNDSCGNVKPSHYKKNIKKMVKKLMKINPSIKILLLGSIPPNNLWSASNNILLDKYMHELQTIAEKFDNTYFLDLLYFWKKLIKRKWIYDVTGNGVNHPNDYGHRVYASLIFDYIIEIINNL